jgi:integrase
MARSLNRLSVKTVEGVKARGYYADGGGLYLQVSALLTKSWVFRFVLDGRAREMGLGSVVDVPLAQARAKAAECRKLLVDRKDPIEERNAVFALERMARAKALTFDECATAYIKANRAGWKNDKHASQWENTLKTYASPVIGKLPIDSIDTGLVLKVLERDQLWTTKSETASRLRGRLEAVLGWSTVRGYRNGDNPAAWRNHLDKVLPARSAVKEVEHHAALPYLRIGTFVETLRTFVGVAPRALEFAILTAARSGETIGATWQEFDLSKGIWTIPAERMKAKKEHRIPLSGRALEIVKEQLPLKNDDKPNVFQTPKGGALSNMAMLAVLKRMSREDLTVHGFRSTFRDWAGETTAYPREVIEHALAHQLKDKAEAAYARGTMFDKRRRLMDEWATYCNTVQQDEGENVVPIRKGDAA